jgi:hypothetical protein
MSFDIQPLDAPGATGSYDSHFASKAAVTCSALVSGGFDFALLHVKAVDDTGHDRMLAMKVRHVCTAHKTIVLARPVGRCSVLHWTGLLCRVVVGMLSDDKCFMQQGGRRH